MRRRRALGNQWCGYGADGVRKRADSAARGETSKPVQDTSMVQLDEKHMMAKGIGSQKVCLHLDDTERSVENQRDHRSRVSC